MLSLKQKNGILPKPTNNKKKNKTNVKNRSAPQEEDTPMGHSLMTSALVEFRTHDEDGKHQLHRVLREQLMSRLVIRLPPITFGSPTKTLESFPGVVSQKNLTFLKLGMSPLIRHKVLPTKKFLAIE
jgi:hypothetical protein